MLYALSALADSLKALPLCIGDFVMVFTPLTREVCYSCGPNGGSAEGVPSHTTYMSAAQH